jgi:hypothetical protein
MGLGRRRRGRQQPHIQAIGNVLIWARLRILFCRGQRALRIVMKFGAADSRRAPSQPSTAAEGRAGRWRTRVSPVARRYVRLEVVPVGGWPGVVGVARLHRGDGQVHPGGRQRAALSVGPIRRRVATPTTYANTRP